MRTAILTFVVFGLFAFLACSNSTEPTPTPNTTEVSMVDNAFQPKNVTITAGDSVKWTNNGIRPHTSTSGTNGQPDGKWDSGAVQPGKTFSHTFNAAGTYPYYCTFHYMAGMTGTVKVNAQ